MVAGVRVEVGNEVAEGVMVVVVEVAVAMVAGSTMRHCCMR